MARLSDPPAEKLYDKMKAQFDEVLAKLAKAFQRKGNSKKEQERQREQEERTPLSGRHNTSKDEEDSQPAGILEKIEKRFSDAMTGSLLKVLSNLKYYIFTSLRN